MRTVLDKIEGDTVINEDTELLGTIVGCTRVCENIQLDLYGAIIGDLVMEQNSRVYLYGVVSGNVMNNGGHLEIPGMANREVIGDNGET